MILKIEELHNFLKQGVNGDIPINLKELHTTSKKSHREKILEGTIREAILKLEETKKTFKSKKVKEVREQLIKVVEQ